MDKSILTHMLISTHTKLPSNLKFLRFFTFDNIVTDKWEDRMKCSVRTLDFIVSGDKGLLHLKDVD
jgi:hypothetical protein